MRTAIDGLKELSKDIEALLDGKHRNWIRPATDIRERKTYQPMLIETEIGNIEVIYNV